MYAEFHASRLTLLLPSLASVAILATSGCGIATLTSAPSEISTRVDELFATMEAGTFADSYKFATTPEFRKATNEAAYKNIGEAVKTRLGRLKSKKTGGINMRVMNGVASLDATYQAVFEKGSATITVRMKKVGADWKVVLLNVNSPIFQQDMATKACSACGAAYAPTARFCPGCGRRLDEIRPTETSEKGPADSPAASETSN